MVSFNALLSVVLRLLHASHCAQGGSYHFKSFALPRRVAGFHVLRDHAEEGGRARWGAT